MNELDMDEAKELTELWIIADNFDSAKSPVFELGFFTSEADARKKIATLPNGTSVVPFHIKAGVVPSDPVTPAIAEGFPLPKMEEMSEGTYYLTPYVYWNLFPRLAKFYKPGREAEALEFIDTYANHRLFDGEIDFYNAWIVSELIRIFTGEDLIALFEEQEKIGRPVDFYAIPEKIYPQRNHDLNYEEYVLPDSGIVALATLIEFMSEDEETLQFATNQAARVLTGPHYDRLVTDSNVEWLDGVLN